MLSKFQDAQEFLRCLMDLLHEELKEPVMETEDTNLVDAEESMEEDKSHSDGDFQSCSTDKGGHEIWSKSVTEHHAEDAMLIQDDENECKDFQKEKSFCTNMNRASSMEDIEKDINGFFETTEFLQNQETVKVQIHSKHSGDFIIGYNRKMCIKCFEFMFLNTFFCFKIPFSVMVVLWCNIA